MGPRWHWDFEDEERARAATPPPIVAPPSAPGPHASVERRAILRRRRGAVIGAGLVAIIAIAAIVALLRSSHATSQPTSSRLAASARLARARRRQPAPDDGQPPGGNAAAVAKVLAYTPFVSGGGTSGRDVALTFDDGPGPYTPGVLSVLERFHVRATFFTVGAMERYFSASTVREIHDDDVIGDHTETHPQLALMSAREQREELFEPIARVELLGGPRPHLFRPPYGSYDATTMRELRRLHLLMVLWSVDTGDYLRPGVSVIAERALTGAHPGAIILMHDAGGDRSQTIAALPAIIDGLRARGYHLVTVPQLLADDPPPAGQPLPANLSGD